MQQFSLTHKHSSANESKVLRTCLRNWRDVAVKQGTGSQSFHAQQHQNSGWMHSFYLAYTYLQTVRD